MTGVDEDLRLSTEVTTDERSGAPIGEVGAVEGGLKELVLDEQLHRPRQELVDRLETIGEAGVASSEIVLARIVRAVRQPEADCGRADLLGDFYALSAVVERPLTDTRVRVTDAPELVRILSEQIRVDRADPQTL